MQSSKLFSPYTIKNLTLKNRIVMSPMCMYSSATQDGKLNNWHYTHYTSRAVGQVGLIIVEASAVLPEGRISYEDVGIWGNEHIEGLQRLTEMVHEHGTKIGIQLAHAGRKAQLQEDSVAPSAIAFEGMKTPKELSKEEITKVIAAFKEAAVRAKKAGFDLIELHGAHGYLINEFLSPLSNHRTDEYGGSVEKRYLFLQQIIEAVKEEWQGPLFVRISSTDYNEQGNTPDTYVTYAKMMKAQGVDLIDCSSGGVVPAQIDVYPGYQVTFAEKIKHEAAIATGAVGIITSGAQAEEILHNNRADLVILGRELLRNPYWAKTAAQELNVPFDIPKQYERGWRK